MIWLEILDTMIYGLKNNRDLQMPELEQHSYEPDFTLVTAKEKKKEIISFEWFSF